MTTPRVLRTGCLTTAALREQRTNGVSPDNTEAASTPDATVGAGTPAATIPTTTLTIDVTASLRAWSTGAINRGWALLPLPGGTDGLSFNSSEAATITQRPKLTVTFMAPDTAQVQVITVPTPDSVHAKLPQRRTFAAELLAAAE